MLFVILNVKQNTTNVTKIHFYLLLVIFILKNPFHFQNSILNRILIPLRSVLVFCK